MLAQRGQEGKSNADNSGQGGEKCDGMWMTAIIGLQTYDFIVSMMITFSISVLVHPATSLYHALQSAGCAACPVLLLYGCTKENTIAARFW